MDRGSSFGRVSRHLRDIGVVMYDRRGYARSFGLGTPASLEVQLDDLAGVIDSRPTVLIGHSLGGALALAAASAWPELIRSVGCYEPPLRWADWWPRPTVESAPEDVAEAFMKRVIGEETWLSLPSGTRQQRRREGRALLADLAAIESKPYDPLRVTVPVLLGVGSESARRFRRSVEELLAELADARLHVIEGAGHGAHMSHPDLFAEFVRMSAALASPPPGYSELDDRRSDQPDTDGPTRDHPAR